MKEREALVLALALACSIALMGWIVWSERPVEAPPPSASTDGAQADAGGRPPEAALDETHVAALEAAAAAAPDDVVSRLALGDLYFGARRFEQAILWYEAALELDSHDGDAGTNLGVSYYYAGQTERAVAQFEQSLEINPSNQRALLSLGIVRAFGLQDIEGATALWERVIEIAPDSPEGRAARDSLDRMGQAHGAFDGGGFDVP